MTHITFLRNAENKDFLQYPSSKFYLLQEDTGVISNEKQYLGKATNSDEMILTKLNGTNRQIFEFVSTEKDCAKIRVQESWLTVYENKVCLTTEDDFDWKLTYIKPFCYTITTKTGLLGLFV